MLEINRIDRCIGQTCLNHRQRVTSKISKLNYVRIGEDIIDGKTRFKEVIVSRLELF